MRLIAGILGALACIIPVAANSTMRYVNPSGLDYFWVPANVLLFHIDYPYDFVLYIFAAYGGYRFVRFMVLDFPKLMLGVDP